MQNRVGIKVNRSNNMKPINKRSNVPISDPTLEHGRVPGLPKDFFETVLDCEVKLKEKFDKKSLQKLIEYYSLAVGYYESINDPKYIMYNQSLQLLFSQPEVKQYLNGGKGKLNIKKENLQKIMNDCAKKVTTDNVKNFIRRKKTIDSKKQINNLINKDMDTQTNDFKKRLAEKKKKYYLSTSDIGATANFGKSLKNLGFSNINEHNKSNQNLEIGFTKEFDLSEKDMPNINLNLNNIKSENNLLGNKNNNIIINNETGDNSSKNEISIGNSNVNSTNNILDELKKEDMNSEIKSGDDSNNLNDSFENKLDYNLEANNPSNKNISINKNNIKFTNKTKFMEKMKLNFDIYSNDYYDHFIKKVADEIVKDYNTHFNELTQTIMDSAVNYINQEKEMEFLISEDSDEAYKNEIGTIVSQLKEEEITTKDKLISDDREKLNKLNEKYYGTLNSVQSAHELEMLKERFKLDTTKSLNNFVFK